MGSGRISYSDFLVATLDWKALIDNEAMWNAFCQFDRDKDGLINIGDIKHAVGQGGCQLNESELRVLMNGFKNNDINFEDFKKLMLSIGESQIEGSPLAVRRRLINTEVSCNLSMYDIPNFQSNGVLAKIVFDDPFYIGSEAVSGVNSKEEIPRIEFLNRE